MKIKNLLLAGLALIGFAACSNEDQVDPQDTDARGDLAYTSLSVRLADNVLTRSGADVDQGTKEENAIETMHVVMYANGRVAYLQDFTITSDGEKTISGDGLATQETISNKVGGFVTKALEVKRQNYDVVVLLNAPTTLLDQLAPGTPYQNLEQAMSEVKASDFMSNGFMMSNAQGVVHLLGTELKDSPESAQENPLKIQVDRVVAKVKVLVELEEENKDAKVEPKSWIVDITNRHTYPLRQLAPQVGGSFEVVDHKNPQNGTARYFRYAKDPNFSAIDLIGMYHDQRLERLKKE
ncbi:MAG: fimbrial protein, partial [Bacteroides sp.]